MAGQEDEDLDLNPMFRALTKGKHRRLFERAQAQCWVVCVPQAACLAAHGLTLSQAVLETHILRPSPYFQGSYETTGKSARGVTIEGNRITCSADFEHPGTARILFEEAHYNAAYQPHRVLCIDRVLNAPLLATTPSQSQERLDMLRPRDTTEDNLAFVRDHCGEALGKMQERISGFLKSYIVVRGFYTDLAGRVASICRACVEDARGCPGLEPCRSDPRLAPLLAGAVECFVLSQLYPKVSAAIQMELGKTLERSRLRLQRCRGVTAADLDIPAAFDCDLAGAVAAYREFSRATTPLAKLHCVKHTLDSISACVAAHHRAHPEHRSEVMTTDDLIPLLVLVVARSGTSSSPHTHLKYTQDFGLASTSASSDLAFGLVTLEAALHFIMSSSFQSTGPVPPPEPEPEPAPVVPASRSRGAGSSRRGRSGGDPALAPAINQLSLNGGAPVPSPSPPSSRGQLPGWLDPLGPDPLGPDQTAPHQEQAAPPPAPDSLPDNDDAGWGAAVGRHVGPAFNGGDLGSPLPTATFQPRRSTGRDPLMFRPGRTRAGRAAAPFKVGSPKDSGDLALPDNSRGPRPAGEVGSFLTKLARGY